MAERVLIDMIKIREAMIANPKLTFPEGLYYEGINNNGLKNLRELAVFRFTCRKCKEAPCITACPAEALEKDSEGIINRHTNLCISCKSCVSICPFGTMMTDFFTHHRDRKLFFDLADKTEMNKFIDRCPEGTVTLTESDERPNDNIYKLNENILIREYLFITDRE
jgi:formate dehydrogenase iron-sulfur subunit